MKETADLLLENQQLREENQKKDSQLQKQNLRIDKLQQQLEQLLQLVYGSKSEKFSVSDSSQMALGFELPATTRVEKKKETITYEREKSSGKNNHEGRLAFPEHLSRVEEIIAP